MRFGVCPVGSSRLGALTLSYRPERLLDMLTRLLEVRSIVHTALATLLLTNR